MDDLPDVTAARAGTDRPVGRRRRLTRARPGNRARHVAASVIDLGSLQELASVRLTWTPGRRRSITVATSADGLGYESGASVPKPRPETTISTRSSARYLAIAVADWQPGDARLTSRGGVRCLNRHRPSAPEPEQLRVGIDDGVTPVAEWTGAGQCGGISPAAVDQVRGAA